MQSKQEADFSKFQAGATIVRLHNLFATNFLQNPLNRAEKFYQSVFIECVIGVDYLFNLKMLEPFWSKITFTDHIVPFEKVRVGRYNNIKELIRFFRNSVCHAEDYGKRSNDLTGQYFAYTFRSLDDYRKELESVNYCPFEDDIAALFGHHVLYINRHLFRAFNELSEIVLPLNEFRVYKKLIELGNADRRNNVYSG